MAQQGALMEDVAQGFSTCGLPERMRDAVKAYAMDGKLPGHFLQALFANDLQGAVARADNENMSHLRDWVRFVYNFMPGKSHGSREIVEAWVNRGGLSRVEA